jgi:alginate O-acetyltransferase complex protein AlgJ
MSIVRTYAVVFGFCGLLALPTVLGVLRVGTGQTMETRPVEQGGAGGSLAFVKGIAQHLNRTYLGSWGGRSTMIYLHSLLNYYGLRQSPIPDRVILGKDGWLFAGNQLEEVVAQHQGVYPLPADSAQGIAQHLLDVQRQLAKRGIRFYVLIAPDTHTIFPEKLPDGTSPCLVEASCRWPDTPHDVLTQTMKRFPQLPYVDVRDTLLQAKKQAHVYQKTDTHWNNYGALVASVALMKRVRADFSTIQPAQHDDFHYGLRTGAGGDLAGQMMLKQHIQEPNLYWIEPKNNHKASITRKVLEPGFGVPTTWFVGPDNEQPNLLLFGDSCSENLMVFIAHHVGKSCFVRRVTLDWQRIDTEKPDIVVAEIVERNLRALAHF